MIISHQHKLIFIHVHRTGGSSVSNLLRDQLGKNAVEIDQHSNVCDLGVDYFKKYSDYFIFGYTRNPWDRLLSWYVLLHQNDPLPLSEERLRFEKFIENDQVLQDGTNYFHYNSLDYFTSKNGKEISCEIFKYENLESNLRSIFNKFHFDIKDIPRLNNTKVKDKKEFYTDKCRQLVAQKCKTDIDYFNYTF